MKSADTTQLLVRNFSKSLKVRLRQQAEQNGHSMEEEARNILRAALASSARSRKPKKFGTWMAGYFKKAGLKKGEEIEELRGHWGQPARFDN